MKGDLVYAQLLVEGRQQADQGLSNGSSPYYMNDSLALYMLNILI